MPDGGGMDRIGQLRLGQLVRSWRERIEPQSIPGLLVGSRTKTSVSQEDVARLLSVSTRWYRKLEQGEAAGYSDDFLDRVCTVLRLNHDERTMLYLLAVGHEPPPAMTPTTVD